MKMLTRIVQKRIPFVRMYCNNNCSAKDWIFSPMMASITATSVTSAMIINVIREEAYTIRVIQMQQMDQMLEQSKNMKLIYTK